MIAVDDATHERVESAPSIRVLVVSDERIFCDAVVARFRHETDLNAVGFTLTGKDFSNALDSLAPEVLVVDTSTDGAIVADVVQTARRRDNRMAIVALISASESKFVTQLVSLGVGSCVLKSNSVAELVTAVRYASQGSGWMSPSLLPRLVMEFQQAGPNAKDARLGTLSVREREILGLMVDGCGQADIAERLCLAFTTIRTHTRNLMDKLGVHSSTAAVSVALSAGFRPSIG